MSLSNESMGIFFFLVSRSVFSVTVSFVWCARLFPSSSLGSRLMVTLTLIPWCPESKLRDRGTWMDAHSSRENGGQNPAP